MWKLTRKRGTSRKYSTNGYSIWIGAHYEIRDGKSLCHVFAGGRRISTFEPQGGGPWARILGEGRWYACTSILNQASTWPFAGGRTPFTVLLITFAGMLAVCLAARRASNFADSSPWRLSRRWGVSLWRQIVTVLFIAAFVAASTPIDVHAAIPNPIFYYHLSDHLSSSNLITNRLGYVVQHYEYTAFGTERYRSEPAEDYNSSRYTGQILDEDTGLYYYNSRYYDPELGRFTQPDTVVPDPDDLQTFNRYSYCGNNPVNMVDPSGHENWAAAARQSKLAHSRENVTLTGTLIPGVIPIEPLFINGLDATALAMAMQGLSNQSGSLSVGNRVDVATAPAGQASQGSVGSAQSDQGSSGGGALINAAKMVGSFIPGVSTVISVYDAYQDIKSGHAVSAALNLVGAIAGVFPVGGIVKAGITLLPIAIKSAKVAHLVTNSARLKRGANLVRQAADEVMQKFAQHPDELRKYLSELEYVRAESLPILQARMFGRGFERAVADKLARGGAPFRYAGGGWGPDFIGTGPLAGISVELTTPGSVASHIARWNPAKSVVTYERPPTSLFFGR